MADDRWLIVGLGNPEGEYGGTRHNIGADTVRVLAARSHVDLGANKRIRCQTADIRVADERATVAVPMSYMNESGGPVQQAAAWLKVPMERLIVIHDDLDLEVGQLRVKRGGGHGGHNGLRDLDRRLGSREYLRVRIGIGRPPGRQPAADYVLRKFQPKDREVVDVTVEEAADACEHLMRHGLDETQNRFNR